jgi:hypothetical protein
MRVNAHVENTTSDSAMTASGLGQSPPRSHILFLLAAVAVSSLAACSDEGGRGSDTMTEPTSATAAASTAGTQVEPGPTTLTAPATTEPVAEEIDDASNQAGSASAPTIEEISAARARALAALPGYTATQTLTGLETGHRPRRWTQVGRGQHG